MTSSSPSLFLTAAALSALLALPGLAQEEMVPAEQEAFFESIAVDIVNVEVYVTDKEGNPITGLDRDDFRVTEDGRPVEVVNFYRVAGGRPESETLAVMPAVPEQETRPPLPMLAEERLAPESQRLHLVIFVDNFNIHPLNRNRVFSRLRVFLNDTLKRGDEAMIASYDRSLNIRQPFTGSVQTVSEVLFDLERVSGSAIERESERADALKEIWETDFLHMAYSRAKQFADNQYNEMENALDALREMLDSLAGLPGRKMLIHLSDGIPMVPGHDLYQAIQQRFADFSSLGEAFTRDLSRRYMQIIATANSNRITFYTIDAGGLRTRSGMGAENPSPGSYTPMSMAVDGTRASNLQGTLRMMAHRTGGRAILNTNDVTAGLEGVARDFGNYYSLGYRAPTLNRGRYHKIVVRLKENPNDWRLRHREGYRDKSLDARVRDSIQAFLVHNYETNPLGVSVDVGQQRADRDGNAVVPVRIRIPMESIVLVPRGPYYEGRLKIYFGATDEKGREAPMQEMPFDLRIPNSAIELARKDEVARVIDAAMRPGPHKLVIAVRDEIGEESSVVGRYLTVAGEVEEAEDPLPPALRDLGGR